ncbi:hypothetical protein, partial [Chitinilyticum litopenaei]|uniref:hypothetical protein n=1 Tax=Chitinilyticum litopenaei TaxID=1121276 RepID=UPI001B7F9CC8
PPNQHQQQDDGLSFLSPADSGKSPSRTLDANNHAGYSRFSDSRTPSPLEGGKPLQANNHAGSRVLEGETPQTAERKENSIEIEGVDYEIF